MAGIWDSPSRGDGSPDAARAALVDRLRATGRLTSEAVEAALRAVPRHLFLPGMAPALAYQDEALVIKSGADGLPLSSSSQPAMMAIMLEQLGLEPGHRVLEIGTGTGYNAALMAHLTGPRGSVVTVDIDRELTTLAGASLARAGYPEVRVVCGDGGYGAPDYAPFDRIMVTAGAFDLAPEWLAQLAPAGRIVLPLSVRGVQLSVALQRAGGHWATMSACRCGFIRMAGALAGPESFVPLGPRPGPYVQAGDGRVVDTGALYAALTRSATDSPTSVWVDDMGELGDADLWLTLTEPGLVRLTITDAGARGAVPLLPFGGVAPARGPGPPGGPGDDTAGGPGDDTAGGLAVAALLPSGPAPAVPAAGGSPSGTAYEVIVRGFGPGGGELAERVAGRVRAWRDAGRPGAADLRLDAYPAGTALPDLPGAFVIVKLHTTLAASWPDILAG